MRANVRIAPVTSSVFVSDGQAAVSSASPAPQPGSFTFDPGAGTGAAGDPFANSLVLQDLALVGLQLPNLVFVDLPAGRTLRE